jgi:DNA replication protein DnaC
MSGGRELFDRTLCDPCSEKEHLEHEAKMEAKAKAESIGKALALWEDLCPPRFRESDENHPEFRRPLLNKVKEWRPTDEKPWLGIVGKKGSCKTRIACMRLREAMMDLELLPPSIYSTRGEYFSNFETPTAPLFITAYDFSEAVQNKFGDKDKDAKMVLRQCMNSWMLVFDDLGKARNTPAVVAGLFALIDHRHAHNLPTIWTANSTPEEFCEGMPPDVAGPMVRRLKESSTLYSVT